MKTWNVEARSKMKEWTKLAVNDQDACKWQHKTTTVCATYMYIKIEIVFAAWKEWMNKWKKTKI